MQKPLDPMSVERTETPSASYVLRRRYGPARHVITVASWVTVISMLFQPVAALAGTVYWDGGGTDDNWSSTANWSAASAGDGAGTADPYTGGPHDIVFYSTTSARLNSGLVNSALAINSFTFGNGQSGAVTIGGTQALTINAGGLTVNNGFGAVSISAPITPGAGLTETWSNNSANTLTVSSVTFGWILNVGGTGNTTITGSGTSEAFYKNDSGTVTVNAGDIKRLGVSGGTLILSGTASITPATDSPALSATLRLLGNTLTCTARWFKMYNNSTVQIWNDGGSGSEITTTSTVTLMTLDAGGNSTYDVRNNGGGGANKTVKFNGVQCAADNTTLNFTGANGYGILFSGSLVPGANAVVLNAGVPVTFTSASSLAANKTTGMTGSSTVTFNGTLDGGGGSAVFNQDGTGTTVLAGGGAFSGAINVKQGTLQVNGSLANVSTVAVYTAGTLTGTGTISGNATLTGNGIINKSGGSIGGTLTVTGGNWNGAGTVVGAVTVNSGTFTIGASGNMTASSGVSIGGGTLSGTGTITGNAAMSSGTINFGSGGNITGTLTVTGGNWNDAGTVGAVTVNSGTFTIGGNMTTSSGVSIGGGTLSGTGTITGNATMSSGNINFGSGGKITGTLTVTGGNWNGAGTVGAVTVNSGTFTGTGTITGPVEMKSGGTLAPGTDGGADELKVTGTVTFRNNSTFKVDVSDSAKDLLTITGQAIIENGAKLEFNVLSALTANEYVIATATDGGLVSGSFTYTAPVGYKLQVSSTQVSLKKLGGSVIMFK